MSKILPTPVDAIREERFLDTDVDHVKVLSAEESKKIPKRARKTVAKRKPKNKKSDATK